MRLDAFKVGELAFTARDIGYGVEEGFHPEAWWTGEIDGWGKFTFATPQGPVYLFEDEFTFTPLSDLWVEVAR
jgi:hypothetical protein